jgi:hypothetical protein
VNELAEPLGASQASAGVAELPNATFNWALVRSVGCENVSVNWMAGPYKTRVPAQFVALEVVFVTGPSVTVSPEPIGTGAPCVAVVVGATVGATVVSFVGPGVGVGGAPTAGIVFTGVGLTVGFAVEPPDVPAEVVAAAAAETIALTAAGSAGVEAATAGDEMGPLGNALDAAAAAGPDDAALL